MNIGIFMQGYLPRIGGAQICTHCLADSLSKMGHNVTVYSNKSLVYACKDRGWQFNYTLKGIDIPSRRLRYLAWLWLWVTRGIMAREVISDKLDVIQVIFAWPWLSVVKELKKLTGVPVVVRCAGDDIQIDNSLGYGMRRDSKVRALLGRGFLTVDRGIAISRTVTKEYIKAGIPKDKIVEIPPGVDFMAFRNCKVSRDDVRKNWGIPTDRRLIISVGRNHPKKGFKDLLKALAILNRKDKRFAVCVVGKDSNNLLPEAESLGVKEDFLPIEELAGMPDGRKETFPSQELIELYKASDYFVFPSYIETYANVALEAMAAGIPVVVTDVPGCIDTVDDCENGLVVPVRAPERIAEKLLLLEEDKGLKDRIVKNGMDKAQNQDWKKIALEYLNTYKALC